jgi:hypothetical protein
MPVWVRAADLIIDGCGWRGSARTGGGALSEQIRIVHEPDARWLGITGSVFHGGVTLFAGRINADGTFADAEAHADAYGLDAGQLVAATRGLWERLDDSGAA